MNRRSLLIAASAFLAPVGAVRAQQRVYTVAWLVGAGRQLSPLRKVLLDRLAQAGFVEGGNLRLVERYAEGQLERLPALALELGKANPDVFLANGTQAALALRDATRDIPIVFVLVSDPIVSGLVADLSRPEIGRAHV